MFIQVIITQIICISLLHWNLSKTLFQQLYTIQFSSYILVSPLICFVVVVFCLCVLFGRRGWGCTYDNISSAWLFSLVSCLIYQRFVFTLCVPTVSKVQCFLLLFFFTVTSTWVASLLNLVVYENQTCS